MTFSARDYMRQYRADHGATINARRRAKWAANPELARAANMESKYGLTGAETDAMLAAQNGQCSICSRDITGRTKARARACVDHCHITGRVRGLLCFRCNSSLGAFNDDPEILFKAIEYLKRAAS